MPRPTEANAEKYLPGAAADELMCGRTTEICENDDHVSVHWTLMRPKNRAPLAIVAVVLFAFAAPDLKTWLIFAGCAAVIAVLLHVIYSYSVRKRRDDRILVICDSDSAFDMEGVTCPVIQSSGVAWLTVLDNEEWAGHENHKLQLYLITKDPHTTFFMWQSPLHKEHVLYDKAASLARRWQVDEIVFLEDE